MSAPHHIQEGDVGLPAEVTTDLLKNCHTSVFINKSLERCSLSLQYPMSIATNTLSFQVVLGVSYKSFNSSSPITIGMIVLESPLYVSPFDEHWIVQGLPAVFLPVFF